jgi:tetratricopeptide (TPR) repeat protein
VKLADRLATQVRRSSVDRNDKHAQQTHSSDAELFQFLSLSYFALEKYEDAAKAAHVALHRGSPWNWKTLSGHYQKTDKYVSQLRTLEKSIREKPSAEQRFLIGYHYLMLGYKAAARAQLTRAAEKNSDDKVIQALLRNLKQEDSR